MLGVKQSLLDDFVRDVNLISDRKLRDMILFGLKCSRDPQKLSEADYEKLRQHQLGQPEILELIAMSALAVYANILADATAMERTLCFTAFGAQKMTMMQRILFSILLMLDKHNAVFS
jgi:hypothetical protein